MNTEPVYKLIIIDDHPLIREGVINYVKHDKNLEFIAEYEDVRSVLNSNLNDSPDVIILDLNLGGINGEKACPLLKEKFPGCKIIAFTQYEDKERELEKIGFDGYVLKSGRDTLITAITEVLKGRKYFVSMEKNGGESNKDFDKMDKFLKTQKLTGREIEVAGLMVQDFSSKEIGKKIFISESTVETHRKHIKEKIGAKNKRELYAILKGYLNLD